MNYNVSYKMPEGTEPKYQKVGKTKEGQYGPYMVVCVEDMEKIIEQAKKDGKAKEFQGKHYFNCSMFENTYDAKPSEPAKQENTYDVKDLDDQIPF